MRNWITLIESSILPPVFWDWFGDSKIVNSKGEPLVVYHGGTKWRTAPGVTWFTDSPHVADGYADQGFEDGSEIKACFLRIENPLDLRSPEHIKLAFPNGLSAFVHPAYADYAQRTPEFALRTSREAINLAIDYAQHHGYDGLIHVDSNVENKGSHTSYVIFNANQVKAASFKGWEGESIYGDHERLGGNKGSYSRTSDDLTEELELAVDEDGYFPNPLPVDVTSWAEFHTPKKARDMEGMIQRRRHAGNNTVLREIPIRDLVAIEKNLHPSVLNNPSSEPPYIEHINGVHYIVDGNHRVVAHHLKGHDTIMARIADYDT